MQSWIFSIITLITLHTWFLSHDSSEIILIWFAAQEAFIIIIIIIIINVENSCAD